MAVLSPSCTDTEETCTELTWYEDADGDGLGNPDVSETNCEQPENYVSNSDDIDDTVVSTATKTVSESLLNPDVFISLGTTNRMLTNGTMAECYQVTFSAMPFDDGPYCVTNLDDVGGITYYDGQTNPGLVAVTRAFYEAMETDGYDIIDDNGNARLTTSLSNLTTAYQQCVELTLDNSVTKTFYIPVTPVDGSDFYQIESDVEDIIVTVDGIKIGEMPNIINMPGPYPANPAVLDPCGGHADPDGSYHWHMIPDAINYTLQESGVTETSCTNFTQSATALVGWAKDGYPVYSYADANGQIPTDLDQCNGHSHATDEFPNGIYHYHARTGVDINVLTCLKGVPVEMFVTVQ